MDVNIIWKILLVLQPFAGTFIVNALGWKPENIKIIDFYI